MHWVPPRDSTINKIKRNKIKSEKYLKMLLKSFIVLSKRITKFKTKTQLFFLFPGFSIQLLKENSLFLK